MLKVTGGKTMSTAISDAVNYQRYTFNKLLPFLGEKIIEIGCGYGSYSKMIAEEGKEVLAIDIDEECIEFCCKRYKHQRVSFLCADIFGEKAFSAIREFKPDTYLMMQVLEHLEDDRHLLVRLAEACSPNTKLVVSVPAFPSLYGTMDSEAGHYRRYTIQSFINLIDTTLWKNDKAYYCNIVGGLAWWINNRLFNKHTKLDAQHINTQIKIFDKYILPFCKLTDPFSKFFFGQTLIATAYSERGHNQYGH